VCRFRARGCMHFSLRCRNVGGVCKRGDVLGSFEFLVHAWFVSAGVCGDVVRYAVFVCKCVSGVIGVLMFASFAHRDMWIVH